jgi:hypothetical protein
VYSGTLGLVVAPGAAALKDIALAISLAKKVP